MTQKKDTNLVDSGQKSCISPEAQSFIDRCIDKGLDVTISNDGKYFLLRNAKKELVGRSLVSFLTTDSSGTKGSN